MATIQELQRFFFGSCKAEFTSSFEEVGLKGGGASRIAFDEKNGYSS
ncbi:MAG: hypothetical protein WBQ89_11370 [Candidatus Acidiferrum sp.]